MRVFSPYPYRKVLRLPSLQYCRLLMVLHPVHCLNGNDVRLTFRFVGFLIFPSLTENLLSSLYIRLVNCAAKNSLSFSFSLNICKDSLKASKTLSYDVASLSSFPRSSLIAVLSEVVSFSNLGLMASIGVFKLQ